VVVELGLHLMVGAIGWDQDRWLEELYPPDLPYEWRLSYYANEFPVVLVPDSYWLKAELPDTGQWLDDVPDHFRFHIHVTKRMVESVRWLDIVGLCEDLKPKLGGWVLQLPEELCKPVKDRLTEMHAAVPTAIVDNNCVASTASWHQDRSADCGAIGVAVLTKRPDPRVLRTLIEDFIDHSSGASRVLFFNAPYGVVADARIIVRLLG